MSRNVWLKFDEWELINNELSDQKYHRFQLSKRQVNEWKKDMEKYPSTSFDSYKFERVGVYPAIEQVKSPRALNILCRENWRSQDMFYLMKSSHDFAHPNYKFQNVQNPDVLSQSYEYNSSN